MSTRSEQHWSGKFDKRSVRFSRGNSAGAETRIDRPTFCTRHPRGGALEKFRPEPPEPEATLPGCSAWPRFQLVRQLVTISTICYVAVLVGFNTSATDALNTYFRRSLWRWLGCRRFPTRPHAGHMLRQPMAGAERRGGNLAVSAADTLVPMGAN